MSNGKNNEKDTLDLRVKKDLPKEGVSLSDEKLDGVAGGGKGLNKDLSEKEEAMVNSGICPKCNVELEQTSMFLRKCNSCGRTYSINIWPLKL